jgi:hypothetical protein
MTLSMNNSVKKNSKKDDGVILGKKDYKIWIHPDAFTKPALELPPLPLRQKSHFE